MAIASAVVCRSAARRGTASGGVVGPVENSVGELWSIMEFLNPGFLGNHTEFRRRFLLPIQKRADSGAALQLRKLTAPFILRRLKTDASVIQDLPAKMEMKVRQPIRRLRASDSSRSAAERICSGVARLRRTRPSSGRGR
jgi:SNF2-related domain